MKIVTVIPDFDLRGTQRVGQNFSLAFKAMGHDVAVLTFAAGGPRRAMFEAGGVRLFEPLPTLQAAVDQVRDFSPDVVHVHRAGLELDWWTGITQRLRPLAKVVVETNIFGRYDASSRDLIDVHFQITRCGLHRWNCLAPPPHRRPSVGVYLPNAMDFGPFVRSDPTAIAAYRQGILGAREGEFVFGRVGKVDPRLLRAFARVSVSHPEARLVSVGQEKFLAPHLAALPAAARERISFVPEIVSDQDLALFYSSIDALMHWSGIGESFGMVLAESIACGTPVVMPLQLHKDIGGIEVIGHGEGGLIAGHGGILDVAAKQMIETRVSFDEGPLAAARGRLVREYDVMTVSRRAIHAMRTALKAKSQGVRLAEAFDQASGFESTLPAGWFEAILRRRIGRESRIERLQQIASHRAAIVNMMTRVRKFRSDRIDLFHMPPVPLKATS